MRLCVFDCCLILRALRVLGTCDDACFCLSGNFGFNRRAIEFICGVCLVVQSMALSRNGCRWRFFDGFCAVSGRTFFTHRRFRAFFCVALGSFKRMG